MFDWLDALPPPPASLPGGWWTVAGVAAACVLLGVVAIRRRRAARAERFSQCSPGEPGSPGEPLRGELLRGELLNKPVAGSSVTGTPEGRHPSPPGLPAGGEERLKRVRAVADFLDNSLKIPGVGFAIGWDSVIGLVPGVGDLATGTLAVWIIVQGRQLGVPKRTLLKMLGNAGIDAAGGAIPGLGDAFDVLFKANRANLRLIEKHLAEPPGLTPRPTPPAGR